MQLAQAIDFNQLQDALPGFRFPLTGGVGDVLFLATQYIFVIAGLALLLYLLYGGFQMMTSGGDPGALKEAQAKITNAIVGFVIIFVAYWLVQLVGVAFGIKEIQDIFQFGGPPSSVGEE